jgi:anaerobic selenocysteine-containing dehydrogenase
VTCDVEDGRLVRVRPDRDHPLGGPFCPKGAAAPEFVYDPVRLRYPMKRTNPKTAADPGWVRISWDEALDTIAARMLDVRSQHGAESVAFYRPAPGGSPSRDYWPWMLRLAHAFGSPNTAATTHICNWHKDTGSAYTYGVGMPEADYDNAGCIIIWGTNPHATGVRHVAPIKAAVDRGAKLIVIDPRRIPLTTEASVWLPVRPGTDMALALGLINQIIEKGAYDLDFLSRWTNAPFLVRDDTRALLTEADLVAGGSGRRYVVWDPVAAATATYDPERIGFQPEHLRPALDTRVPIRLGDGTSVACTTVFAALREISAEYTLERTASLTTVSEAAIAEAAEAIGSQKPVCYYSYNGLEQHSDAMQTNRAICILYALTGDFDRKGGMVTYPALPTRPVAGIKLLPQEVADRRLGVEKRPLGPAGGPHKGQPGNIQAYEIYNAITTGKPYPVKALISFGGNLIVSNGDTLRGLEAVRQLEFYVHMDCYENPTARFADILLPAASAWESEALGQYKWRDRGHIQMRRGVVPPEFERRSDLDVIFALARRLGLDNVFFGGDTETAYNEMLSPMEKTASDIRGMVRGMAIPLSPTYRKFAAADPGTGRPRGFDTPSRLMEIYSRTFADHGFDPLPRFAEAPERRVDTQKYPLVLTASKPGAFTHGSYRSIPSLRKLVPEPCLEINPETARNRGISDGDWVALETPKGSIRVKARFDGSIHPDVVSGQEGWWQGCEPLGLPAYDPFDESGANLNLLFSNDVIDPISGSVPHRGHPCEVRRL